VPGRVGTRDAPSRCWVRHVEGGRFQVFATRNRANLGLPRAGSRSPGASVCPCARRGAYYEDGSRASGPAGRADCSSTRYRVSDAAARSERRSGQLPTLAGQVCVRRPKMALLRRVGGGSRSGRERKGASHATVIAQRATEK